MIQETFNLNTLSGLVKMLKYVLKGTFIVEGIGAVLVSFQFIPEYGPVRGICYSIFHAISTFCNAGLDILGDSSLQPYVTNHCLWTRIPCLAGSDNDFETYPETRSRNLPLPETDASADQTGGLYDTYSDNRRNACIFCNGI